MAALTASFVLRIPLGDRPPATSGEGHLFPRAERRAAPKPALIPLGDRPTATSDEGPQ